MCLLANTEYMKSDAAKVVIKHQTVPWTIALSIASIIFLQILVKGQNVS